MNTSKRAALVTAQFFVLIIALAIPTMLVAGAQQDNKKKAPSAPTPHSQPAAHPQPPPQPHSTTQQKHDGPNNSRPTPPKTGVNQTPRVPSTGHGGTPPTFPKNNNPVHNNTPPPVHNNNTPPPVHNNTPPPVHNDNTPPPVHNSTLGVRNTTTVAGHAVTTDGSGRVRQVTASNGAIVHRSVNGSRAFEHNLGGGRRVVGAGAHRGFVERPFRTINGHTYIQRTYVVGGRTYAVAYRQFGWRGYRYYGYAPAFYWHAGFYGWAYNPWVAPVYWGWGWAGSPWLGFYGPYFAPEPFYPSASLWLTDYILAENLQLAYEMQQAPPAPVLASNSGTTIEIPGNQAWVDTGVAVQPGDTVAISASGAVSMGGGWPLGPPAGLPKSCDGRGFPAPNARCWSLIGRVGENGPPFYVGNARSLRAPIGGELYLGVNDNQLGDNTGSWMAVISSPGAAAPQPDASSASATATAPAALTPEVKAMIAEEVRQQLAAEKEAATAQSAQPAGADDNQLPPALDPKNRVFVVATSLDITPSTGEECALTPGDILLRTGDKPDGQNKYTVSVQSSKQGDCSAGVETALSIDDLQEMHNQLREKIDAGLQQLAAKQGTGGLPNSPDTHTTPGEAQPTPDSDAVAKIQDDQKAADAAEKDVNNQRASLDGAPHNTTDDTALANRSQRAVVGHAPELSAFPSNALAVKQGAEGVAPGSL